MEDSLAAVRPVAKAHHYNPQHHLARFTNPSGMLLVYDRHADPAKMPRSCTPKNAGFEKWLYAPEDGSAAHHDDTIEVWLANSVDGPAVEPIDRLIAGKRPSRAQRKAMARFVAAQDLRTPSARDWILAEARRRADQKTANFGAIRDRIGARIRAAGFGLSEQELDRWEKDFASGARRISIDKEFWLDYLETRINMMAPGLEELSWSVVRAPATVELVLSDAAVVKSRPGFRESIPYAPGWTKGTEWVFPLSPSDALRIRQPGSDSGLTDSDWFQRVNSRAVEQARRAVVARSPQHWIPGVFAASRPASIS